MDHRFVCSDCGAKWFVHEQRVGVTELTECGRCGGPLAPLHGGDRDHERYGGMAAEDGNGEAPG